VNDHPLVSGAPRLHVGGHLDLVCHLKHTPAVRMIAISTNWSGLMTSAKEKGECYRARLDAKY
jgi:hypothetical protein